MKQKENHHADQGGGRSVFYVCAPVTYCGQRCIVKHEGDDFIGVTLKCKSWTCPDCYPDRRKRLIAEAIGGQPTAFLTLTIRRHESMTANEAATRITAAWPVLVKRITRRYGIKHLARFVVMEATKLGWPHLHVLLRGQWIDQAWLSAQMLDLLDSPVVDIRKIDGPGRVAGYVAKYVGKATHKFGTCKRYWQSRDYDLRTAPPERPKARPGEGWEVNRFTLEGFIERWRAFGYRLERISNDKAVATGPPDYRLSKVVP